MADKPDLGSYAYKPETPAERKFRVFMEHVTAVGIAIACLGAIVTGVIWWANLFFMVYRWIFG